MYSLHFSYLQCLDPILTAAAISSSREVFFTPPGMRDEQRKVRRSFSKDSDLMCSVRAYYEYQDVLREEGWDAARGWCSDNFVSINALSSIHSVRSQLINELNRIGLIDNGDIDNPRGRNKRLRVGASVNRNASVEPLYKAIWATGLPDNLASRRGLGAFGTLRTSMENHAGLHPSSVSFHRKPPKNRREPLPPWFFYREMVLSSQVFLRGCTSLEPEQVLLFGGYNLTNTQNGQGRDGQRVLDDWILVEGRCNDTIDVLSTCRDEINAALEMKVMYPRFPLPGAQQSILDAVSSCFDVLGGNDESDEWR